MKKKNNKNKNYLYINTYILKGTTLYFYGTFKIIIKEDGILLKNVMCLAHIIYGKTSTIQNRPTE